MNETLFIKYANYVRKKACSRLQQNLALRRRPFPPSLYLCKKKYFQCHSIIYYKAGICCCTQQNIMAPFVHSASTVCFQRTIYSEYDELYHHRYSLKRASQYGNHCYARWWRGNPLLSDQLVFWKHTAKVLFI